MVESTKFSSLGLKDWLVRQILAVGFKDPKTVQVQCIPPILEGEIGTVATIVWFEWSIFDIRQGLLGMC